MPRFEIRPLTSEQARKFLAAVSGDRLEALYAVALAIGLRKGEALGLRWDDIDLETATITVRHSLQRIDSATSSCPILSPVMSQPPLLEPNLEPGFGFKMPDPVLTSVKGF